MSTETTYTAQETTEAVEYVSAIVATVRAEAQAKQEAAAQAERAEAQAEEARRLEMLQRAREQLPERIRAFVDVEPAPGNDQWRAVVSLPGCAPFRVMMNAGYVRSFFNHAEFYYNDDDEPVLSISWSTESGTLEDAIARAYEADSKYCEALAVWERKRAEREHAEQMSERESALRHEEEPEAPEPDEWSLSSMTADEILHLAERSIDAADMAFNEEMLSGEKRAAYYLMRAGALARYVSARNSAYIGRLDEI